MAATRPFAPYEWMVAARYLRAKKQERFVSVISVISLVGIALGVATLIIVMAVMNGFRVELLNRILGLNGHLVVEGVYTDLVDYDATAARLRAIPGVERVAPILNGQVMATAHETATGAFVRGMRTADLASLKIVAETLSPGALERYASGDAVIIGFRLARSLGLHPGMTITLISPKGAVTPFGSTLRRKSYTVAGTFDIGMSEYDQIFIFMPLEQAQLFFNKRDKDAVTSIEIMVSRPDRIEEIMPAVREASPPGTGVADWQKNNESYVDALEVERVVMFLILSLIILVAALNIISGLVMLVKDKGRDIAILRTMGATRGAVMRMFMIAGSFVGLVGTLIGFLIGVVFCANIEAIRQFMSSLVGTTLFDPAIYFLSRMPAEMDTDDVIAVVVMALSLSFLATVYPSWRAARLDPVEALRYE